VQSLNPSNLEMDKSSNTLVIQSFGRENEYRRAIFTVLSFYAHCSLPVEETKVLLFTDKPDYFENYFSGLPVNYILLTPEKIKNMRGAIDFLHRMKIALIEESFALSGGPLFYTDSDAFFISDPAKVFATVSESKAFMHLTEYPFVRDVEDKTDTYRKFYELISRESFALTNGNILKVTSQHKSWNAGVMAFHPSHIRLIPDVYCLTEQFYSGSGSHASEQYAFSLVMQENLELKACDDVVYHYWYRVKKQIIDTFLEKELLGPWALLPLEQKLAKVKSWTNILPSLFEKHVWMIRDHAIQAFNENRFSEGYRWAAKALLRQPFGSTGFLKDSFYHLKRHLTHK
jgi:hypothetical protein